MNRGLDRRRVCASTAGRLLLDQPGARCTTLDALARDVGIIGIFTDWPSTATFYANCMGLEPLPVKRGSPTKPVPGYAVRIVDEAGQSVAAGTSGNIVIDPYRVLDASAVRAAGLNHLTLGVGDLYA